MRIDLSKSIKICFPFFLVIALFSYYRHFEQSHDYFRYKESVKPEVLPFQYKEVSKQMGINHETEYFVSTPLLQNYIAMAPSVQYVAAGDLNGDQFVDLVFTTGSPNQPLKIYFSEKGENFSDVTNTVLKYKGAEKSIVYAFSLIDFDNDGWLDIYSVTPGCHEIWKNEKGQGFRPAQEEFGVDKICHRATNITLMDYNNDGFLDLYFNRLYRDRYDQKNQSLYYFIPRINKVARESNATNYLVENVSGKKAKLAEIGAAKNNLLAWTSGATDLDGDGFADLIVANDFSILKVYHNNAGKGFTDVTSETLGDQYHSANMSVVTGDFNNDAKTDFFVSGISRSTFSPMTHNYLFSKVSESGFENKSFDAGVEKCAWSWGGQFIDPDHDAKLDLFVVNGMFNDGPSPYWYKWAVYGTLPHFLVSGPDILPNTSGTNLEGDNRNCLFWQNENGHFSDISLAVGINDTLNGRGVAVADLKNDGSFDLIIANHKGPPLIYKQQTKNSNYWIGLSLKGTSSNSSGIGSKIYLTQNQTKRLFELFPTNGFSAQNDSRLLIGLGSNPENEIEIVWPSGKRQTIKNLAPNQYHTITEL